VNLNYDDGMTWDNEEIDGYDNPLSPEEFMEQEEYYNVPHSGWPYIYNQEFMETLQWINSLPQWGIYGKKDQEK